MIPTLEERPGVPRHIEIPCPHCRRVLRVRSQYVGLQVSCNRCDHVFLARPPVNQVVTESVAGDSTTVLQQLHEAQAQLIRLQDQIQSLQQQLDQALGQHRRESGTPHHGLGHDPQTDVTMASETDSFTSPHTLLTSKSDSRLRAVPVSRSAELAFPGFQVLDTIRDGAMGRVFRARQVSLDRIVAIKMLHASLAGSAEHRERFEREARISAKLAHPNIVKTIDAGTCCGRPYFVMEYIEGRSIQDWLDRKHKFDEKTVLQVAVAISEALRHMEERNFIHRDIKPANVLLSEDGRVKLLDFGLARPTDDEDWAACEAGMAIGTPSFISPEQIRGQVDIDIRSDLYSLGATIYLMLTGVVPYPGTTAEVMQKHTDLRAACIPPGQLREGLSEGLGAIVQKLMAKNRENRYRHPGDLIPDLLAVLRHGRLFHAGSRPEPHNAAISESTSTPAR